MGVCYFTNRVVNHWNSLPNWLVTANNANVYKNRHDQYSKHQDIIYDFWSKIDGTGGRSSEVFRENTV